MDEDNNISMEACLNCIRANPFFSDWPPDILIQFAHAWLPLTVKPGVSIVKEGDTVDAVYLIVSGMAEVNIHDLNTHENKIVASLGPGESIGLGVQGLHSKTEKRSATVTAITPLVLIKLQLDTLQDFFHNYPQLKSILKDSINRLLKMKFIKSAVPFSNLSPESLSWLTDKIEVQDITKETVIFKQGEAGDYCYLIIDGKVEISRVDEQGKVTPLAVLSTGMVFGEAAIFLDAPRSASAICLTNCKLYRIFRDDLIKLISISHVEKSISAIMLERSRPERCHGIIKTHRISDEKEDFFILKNKENHAYYQLTEKGNFLWELIDGKRTLKEITLLYQKEYSNTSPKTVAILTADLNELGFIKIHGYRFRTDQNHPKWVRVLDAIRHVMEATYDFPLVDTWVTKTYDNFVKFLFYKTALVSWLLVSITGMIVFCLQTPRVLSFTFQVGNFIVPLTAAYVACYLSTPLHELAHAYTTKYYGREVRHFGVGWYWVGIVAYTDTSDMWLSSKWPRIMVSVAGPFLDTILAGISSYCAWLAKTPELIITFWLFAFFNYITAYKNLYPLIELDGYYILMDYFDRAHLREDAVKWLAEVVPKIFHQPVFTKKYHKEIAYWIICLCFISISPVFIWLTQYIVLGQFFHFFRIGWWQVIFPSVTIFLAFLTVWNDVKKDLQQLKKEDQESFKL